MWQWKAFCNWIREVLLAQYVPEKDGVVVDIAPVPHGLDGGKIARCGLSRYVTLTQYPDAGRDAATCASKRGVKSTSSVSEVNLCDELLDPREYSGLSPYSFDTVLAMDPGGVVSHSFRDETSARVLMNNVAKCLRPGGIFCGILPDSSELFKLVSKMQMRESMTKSTEEGNDDDDMDGTTKAAKPYLFPPVKGELFKVQFDVGSFEKYGTVFSMRIGENECYQGALVHFPSFISVARTVGLQLVEMKNFRDVYEEHQSHYADKIAAANLKQLHHNQLEVIGLYHVIIHSLFHVHLFHCCLLLFSGMFTTFAFVKVP